jgi:hypothetical protein
VHRIAEVRQYKTRGAVGAEILRAHCLDEHRQVAGNEDDRRKRTGDEWQGDERHELSLGWAPFAALQQHDEEHEHFLTWCANRSPVLTME